jgi:esterase/lipase
MKGVSSKDKRLSVLRGGWHEMVHGPEKGELMSEVLGWVGEHSVPRSHL